MLFIGFIYATVFFEYGTEPGYNTEDMLSSVYIIVAVLAGVYVYRSPEKGHVCW